MAKLAMELSFVIVLLVSFVSSAFSGCPLPAIKPWCAQTLYPELCEYFFTVDPKYGNVTIHQKSDFLKISIQLVLDRAINSTRKADTLVSKCRNSREKAAWVDCLDLYKKTITMLNQTVALDSRITPFDIQTRLSTTLTNLDTCQQGFIDFGITDNVMPLIMDIVLKNLTINSLALNYGSYNCKCPDQHGFPTWLSLSDRRLLQSSSLSFQANIVVAQDGSGNYATIKDAIDVASNRPGTKRFVIYVKAGIYEEYIQISSKNIMLVGDGIGNTIITGNKNFADGTSTYLTATVIVEGNRFISRDITFRNTAGPLKGQAVAFRSESDYSVYYKCSFEGYQDTLFVRANTQFYRECDVYGTVDFICGDATVMFQDCNIFARNPPNKVNVITAQSRDSLFKSTGMSFHNCKVEAASDLETNQSSVRTYLGRPWRDYSRVVFMKTYLDSLIDPEGWMPWGNNPIDYLYYGEYGNGGPGSSTANRVKWPSYHVIDSDSDAAQFSVREFICGDSWLPGTGVPFYPDL